MIANDRQNRINAYKSLVERTEGKRQLARIRCRWKENRLNVTEQNVIVWTGFI
jgi:hypothetical protein